MCLVYQLSVSLGQFTGHLLAIAVCPSYVIHTFKDDNSRDTLLLQDIAVVTLDTGGGQAAAHHTIATDTQIQYGEPAAGLMQTGGKDIGPTVLQISRRAASVSNRIAQHGDSTGTLTVRLFSCGLSIGHHVNSSNVVPMVYALRAGKIALGRRFSF